MSADVLRRAAAKIRETARAATPGTWEVFAHDSGLSYRALNVSVITSDLGDHVAEVDYDGFAEGPHAEEGADAAHIALWSPPVALAVADWLDAAAEHVASFDCMAHCEPQGCAPTNAALHVARLILGGDA